LTAAQSEQNDIAGADRTYDQAQETLASLCIQADGLIQETVDELRFNLRKKDAPSQRRIIRTYGGSYSYLSGEPLDEEVEGG
jgi:hypothetical protein